MSQYDLDRISPDRIELRWIARGIYSSSVVDLTGIVLVCKRSRKNRIQSEVDPTRARHTSECISRVSRIRMVLESGDDLRKSDSGV